MQGDLNMGGKWWQQPVRMLRVDYAPDFSVVKGMDLARLARSRRDDWQINCEWVVGTLGFAGEADHTTFKAEGFETCPGFGEFDYLRSYTPHAHENGIRVVSYLNMHWYRYAFADLHSEWEQVMSDGRKYGRVNPLYGDGTTLCVNASWREFAFNLIREAMKTGIDGVFLDGPVIFPDSCYCESCQKLFKEQTGQAIPQEDWQNPLWQTFLDFREDSMARFLKNAQEAMREINPEGVIFLNASNWHPDTWRVARDNQKVAPYQTFNGAEAFFHYGKVQNTFETLMTGKFLRAVDEIPAVLFTHYMNGVWHCLNMPEGEVTLALVQTLAAGVNPWLATMKPALESQPESTKPVREIFGFQEENKAYYTQIEPVAEAAIFLSKRTGRTYISRFEELYATAGSGREENLIVNTKGEKIADWKARKQLCEEIITAAGRGYFNALTRAHVAFDILLDQQLTPDRLAKYKTIVLPDCACLSAEDADSLKAYVRNGGNLVASFEAGFYDEKGQFTQTMFELFGLEDVEGAFPVYMGENYIQLNEDYQGWKRESLIERGAYVLKVKAASSAKRPMNFMEPLAKVYTPLKGVSPYPALVLNTYGKGRVAYFSEAVGHFYDQTGMISAEKRIAQTVRKFIGESIVTIDAPKTVAVELFRQKNPDRLLIHLVNVSVDGRPVNEFLPVRDINLKVRVDRKPKKVFALRENTALESSCDGTNLKIKGLSLSVYDVIVLEF
jgi:hypothetical protein